MVFKLENQDRRPYVAKIKAAIIAVFHKFPKEPSDEPTLNLSRGTLTKYIGEIECLFYGRYKEEVQVCIEFFNESVKKLPDDIRYWNEGLRRFTSYPAEPMSPSSAQAPSTQAPHERPSVPEQAPLEASESSTPIKTTTDEPPVPILSSPTPPKSSSRHESSTTSSPGSTSSAPTTSSPLSMVSGPVGSGGSTPKSWTPSPPAHTSFASIMRLAGAEAHEVPDTPSPELSTTRQKATPSPINGIKSLMSMIMEEKAARTQAQIEQRQMNENILQHLTALEEGSRSRQTEAADARAKEFAEREAAVSSREGAVKVREEEVQAAKAEAEKMADKLPEQQKAQDAKEKAAHSEKNPDAPSKSPTTLSPRSQTKQKVAHLTSLILATTAIIKLSPLEKGRLLASLSGLKSPSLHPHPTNHVSVPRSQPRKTHLTSTYTRRSRTSPLFSPQASPLVFEKGNWRDYELVCSQRQILNFTQTVNCLQGARALFELDIVQVGVEDEFEDEEPAKAEDVMGKYRKQFEEYLRALVMLTRSTPAETRGLRTWWDMRLARLGS
ncbi:hypothetical protein PtrSN002B_001640 [Pyrenophora tritici-repentis]|uniref:Uncharacterized protein n=1 Tax=Pyrenophora tritici-repentis TaxID=45151 RepID=A0A2W1GUU0_9PLEO|nr:hypothetical protein PtrV1_04835 [Pyrenophora tritici-repentis]KAG9386870.1 hypothetical protein A1F94_003620 [Pyrenophora tritici-repentis]KAI0575948.1 hypothetical protein Alg215_07721 [Pyrenophora tritici-repentis]KAI0585066.1 hypothetical protein Alg130_04906 [Pyrenophora tritici-repentis]KAI0610868.1 hypothetical protein TUN205_04907 [Pyrenophora tritici-repentis]